MDFYQTLLRPILFSGLQADPEWLHQQTLQILGWLDQPEQHSNSLIPLAHWLRSSLRSAYQLTDPRLVQTCWGLTFQNPLGLAAGFDKDGVASGIWPDFGFGFAELGTVTFHAQPGNPQPRLFRLTADRAALNRMGFNNQGAVALASRLQRQWGENPHSYPVGINLGKSKVTPLEEAVQDYVESFRVLSPLGDYFVVNVSSPNTPGLRSLQATEQLAPILAGLQQANQAHKPLLVKIAPDLEWEQLAALLDLAQAHRLSGVIATNTTISRSHLQTRVIKATGKPITEESGGISGAPLQQRSTDVIRFIWKETQGQLPIIGVGGIFTAEDAWAKITAGASLIQVYTGWIYEGPMMAKAILQGLLQKLECHQLSSITDAIGLEHRSP